MTATTATTTAATTAAAAVKAKSTAKAPMTELSPANVAAAKRAAAIARMKEMVASRIKGQRQFSSDEVWNSTPSTSRTTVREGGISFTASSKHPPGVTPEEIGTAAAAKFVSGKFSSSQPLVGDSESDLQSERSLSGADCSIDRRYKLAADVIGGFAIADIEIDVVDVIS